MKKYKNFKNTISIKEVMKRQKELIKLFAYQSKVELKPKSV